MTRKRIKKRRWVVGLTGGIASGKSTVLELFARRGAATLSADALVHASLKPGQATYRAVVRHFGLSYLDSTGALDRKKLGSHAFKHAAARRALERMVHPVVIRGLKSFVRTHSGLIILDIPLLFEAGLRGLVHETIVVFAFKRQQMARARMRSAWTATQTAQRLRAQWPLKRKVSLADHVFDNTRDRAALKRQVDAWLRANKRKFKA